MRAIARIAVIEDSPAVQLLLGRLLSNAGYKDTKYFKSVEEAQKEFASLKIEDTPDLILMDIVLPGIDGIEGTRLLKGIQILFNVPIIVMTAHDDDETIDRSYKAGAMDYIRKPFRKVELISRIGAALRLRHEMERRRQREEELMAINNQLTISNIDLSIKSNLDGLTGLGNRLYMDNFLISTWKEAAVSGTEIAFVMLDVDYFKKYNDLYGHPTGDQCLKQVAGAIDSCLFRKGDTAVRYGGEEFGVILPNTTLEGAQLVAERIRMRVRSMQIKHAQGVGGIVTVTAGCSVQKVVEGIFPQKLIDLADSALYEGKHKGRDTVVAAL